MNRAWVLPLGLFALVVAVYSLAPATGFLYDDHEVIQNHEGPRTAADIVRIFRERHFPNLPYYRPITRTTLLVQKSVWGEDPAVFRLFNALLLAAGAVLVFLLLRLPTFGFRADQAAFAAALFALHPIASSCVYPISSGRETLMPAVWMLGAMYAWLSPGRRARWVAYGLFAGALLSKEQAVVLPLLFLLADGMLVSLRGWALRYAPLLAIAAAYFAVRHLLFGGAQYAFAGLSGIPLALLYGLQTVFLPFAGLHYEPELAIWLSLPRLAVALEAVAALCWFARREAMFWMSWFAIALLPTANLLQQEAPFDERYVFLASLGTFALVARILPARRIAWVGAGAVVLAAAGLSIARAQYFEDDIAFSQQWLVTNPRSVNAEYNLGFSLARRGDFAAAAEHYQKALALRPDYAFAHNNLGNALVALGRAEEALPHFAEAVRLDPGYFEAYFNWGLALCRNGDLSRGVPALERAAQLRPDQAAVWVNLGNAYAASASTGPAAQAFERALFLEPGSAEAHSNYAVLLAGSGRIDEAIAHLREALRLNPALEDARRNLDAVLAARGQ